MNNTFFALMAAFSYFFLPLTLGLGIKLLAFLMHNTNKRSLEDVNLGSSFLYGSLFTFVYLFFFKSFFVNYLGLDFSLYFHSIFLLFALAIFAILFFLTKNSQSLVKLFDQTAIFHFLLIASVAVTFFLIWIYRSPFPLNWDLYEHQTLSNLIQKGEVNFLTSRMSDTFRFDSYPPFFHNLLAISQKMYNLNPATILKYWKFLTLFHIVLVGSVTYSFSLKLDRSRVVALIAAISNVLIFDSAISFTNLMFLPQTVTALLGVSVLGEALKNKFNINVIDLSLIFISILFLHYAVGLVLIAIFSYCLVYYKYADTTSIVKMLLTVIPIICVGSLLFINKGDLAFVNPLEADDYIFSYADKIEFLKRFYGYLLILVPIGLLSLFFTPSKRNQKSIRIFSVVFILLVIVFFTDIPYVLKFFTITKYLVSFFIAYGFVFLNKSIKFNNLRIANYVLYFVVLFILGLSSIYFFKKDLFYKEQYNYLSQDYIEAATFLQNYQQAKKVFIISDPGTQYILEGLSGANSAGGAFASQSTRKLISASFRADSLREKISLLKQVEDDLDGAESSILLVLSGRTFVWQDSTEEKKASNNYNIWTPVDLSLSNKRYIKTFADNNYDVIFENGSLAIIKLS